MGVLVAVLIICIPICITGLMFSAGTYNGGRTSESDTHKRVAMASAIIAIIAIAILSAYYFMNGW